MDKRAVLNIWRSETGLDARVGLSNHMYLL
jgi:hypothetical protein